MADAANPRSEPPKLVLPAEGGCRCGRVRFRVSAPPLLAGVCHCRGCQRMSASAFSTTIAVPEAGFAVIAGDTVIGGIHGDEAEHHHCEWCKSWLFTRPGQVDAGFVNVRPVMLDDARWFVPWLEMQTDDQLPWAQTGAKRSFARFPPLEEYPALIAAYQAERGGN